MIFLAALLCAFLVWGHRAPPAPPPPRGVPLGFEIPVGDRSVVPFGDLDRRPGSTKLEVLPGRPAPTTRTSPAPL